MAIGIAALIGYVVVAFVAFWIVNRRMPFTTQTFSCKRTGELSRGSSRSI